ncbi:MAG: thiolase domain-containing protein, partial [Anaerolineae bacterium]|nr:thiolase domain-containing protein [Anaerolineae bacterium]
VVLAPADLYKSKIKAHILASAVAIDSLAIHDRRDPMTMDAVMLSSQKAYAQARLTPADIKVFEAHDAFSIMAALSLEAAGFAPRGGGVRLAADGEIGIHGRIPISTMGGLKARGHPVGATGIYQIVEVVQQLTGQAGKNQVPGATIGMAQNTGGSGATVIPNILGAA